MKPNALCYRMTSKAPVESVFRDNTPNDHKVNFPDSNIKSYKEVL